MREHVPIFHLHINTISRKSQRLVIKIAKKDLLLPGAPIAVNGFQALDVTREAASVPAPAASAARRTVGPGHVLGSATFLLATRRRAPQTLAGRHIRADFGSVAKDEFALLVFVEILARQFLGSSVIVQHVRQRFVEQALTVAAAIN